MEIVKGGEYIIKHTPGWLGPPIVIPCVVVKIGVDKMAGKVIVNTDLQKGVIVESKYLQPKE